MPILLFGLWVLLPRSGSGEVVERIVTLVNNELITLSELEEMGKPILDQVRQTASPAEREERLKKARREVLDHLFESKLLEEEMKKKKIEVSDRDVDAAIQDILKTSNLSEDGKKPWPGKGMFTKNHGNMAEAGAVAWQFHKKGLLTVDKTKVDEDRLLTLALDAGAEDVKAGDKLFEVITDSHDFEAVKKALADAKIEAVLSEITYIPQNTVRLDEKPAEQMLKLMEIMDEHDDVQKVHANFDISDEVMEKVAITSG